MGPRTITLCLTLLLVDVARAQALGGIELIGGCDTPGEAFSVAVSGDYAYVADGYAGLRVVSVSDPAHPVEVGSFDTPGWAHGVAISGNHVFVADYDSGLSVISVADPTNPVEVGHFDTPGPACGVAANGDRVYVAADTGGLCIISVADPAHPTELGRFDTQDRAWGIAVRGDTAHVASIDLGFSIISALDPAHPAIVGGFFAFHTRTLGGVTVNGEYAYITHDSLGLVVMSIAQSQILGYCGAYNRAGGLAAGYGYVYVAADEAGLWVISVANPTQPVEVAFYDAPNQWANGVTLCGGYAYVAYGVAGLQVFQALGGIEEGSKPRATSLKPEGTVVRALPAGTAAFDAMGRRVLNPEPGVYLVLPFLTEAGRRPSAVSKFIIAR